MKQLSNSCSTKWFWTIDIEKNEGEEFNYQKDEDVSADQRNNSTRQAEKLRYLPKTEGRRYTWKNPTGSSPMLWASTSNDPKFSVSILKGAPLTLCGFFPYTSQFTSLQDQALYHYLLS